MQVKEFMRRPYIADKDLRLIDAAKIMSSKDINCLIFVKNNRPIGIITDSDLLKNFGKNRKITQIMSKNIITIGPEETIDEALKLMRENKIKKLPVLGDKKNLLGIITTTDLIANLDKFEGEFFFN